MFATQSLSPNVQLVLSARKFWSSVCSLLRTNVRSSKVTCRGGCLHAPPVAPIFRRALERFFIPLWKCNASTKRTQEPPASLKSFECNHLGFPWSTSVVTVQYVVFCS